MRIWITQDYRNLARMVIAGVIPKKEARRILDVAHPMSSESKMGYYEEVLKAGQEAKKGSAFRKVS